MKSSSWCFILRGLKIWSGLSFYLDEGSQNLFQFKTTKFALKLDRNSQQSWKLLTSYVTSSKWNIKKASREITKKYTHSVPLQHVREICHFNYNKNSRNSLFPFYFLLTSQKSLKNDEEVIISRFTLTFCPFPCNFHYYLVSKILFLL